MFEREKVIWAAGVIEGEGYLAAVKQSRTNTHVLRVGVSMTDRDVLERLVNTFGLGRVKGPRQRGSNKPIYVWEVTNFEGAQAIMAAIYPWMGERRKQQILDALRLKRETRKAIKFCRQGAHTDERFRRHTARGDFCDACRDGSAQRKRDRERARRMTAKAAP